MPVPTTLPAEPVPATTHEDDAYLEFLSGIRRWQMTAMRAMVKEQAPVLVSNWTEQAGREPEGQADAHAIFDNADGFRWRHLIERLAQEKLWDGATTTYDRRRQELEAELDRTDAMGPGTVRWSPDFPVPDYIRETNFHLQPGGYHVDPLLGHVYHRGTDVYVGGKNDVHRPYVGEVPVPADGQVRRILDLGCAVGQSTTAFKERFPDAEVWGIDVSAPMVRYAHRRAVAMGLDVNFAQMSVDAMDFEDGTFDIVYAYILFHETPLAVTHGAFREAFRVLRPGGLFVINDIGPRSTLNTHTPLGNWFLDFAIDDNEDPFARDFVLLDVDTALSDAGFTPPSRANTAEIGLGSKGLVVATR